MQEWHLAAKETTQTDKSIVQEKIPHTDDSVAPQQIPFPTGNYAYYPPPPPTYCCEVYRLSIERHFKPWHSKGCEVHKEKV